MQLSNSPTCTALRLVLIVLHWWRAQCILRHIIIQLHCTSNASMLSFSSLLAFQSSVHMRHRSDKRGCTSRDFSGLLICPTVPSISSQVLSRVRFRATAIQSIFPRLVFPVELWSGSSYLKRSHVLEAVSRCMYCVLSIKFIIAATPLWLVTASRAHDDGHGVKPAFAIRMSVRPSVCLWHTRDRRLNGSRYRKMLFTTP